jgi:hypothetical protein
MTPIRVRGGSGLGDSLYLRPIAENLAKHGPVTACSNYPDVFRGSGVRVDPFRRDHIDIVAHYINGKSNSGTTMWQDICANARVDAPLKFEWTVGNADLIRGLKDRAQGRPMVLVHSGREPMGRKDGFGLDLLPIRAAFCAVLWSLMDCFTIRIGSGNVIYDIPCEADYYGKTSVGELIDIASVCDGVVSMCGFPVPMAECLDKPLLAVWAAKGLVSANQFIRTCTPSKILSKATSSFVMDDAPLDKLQESAHAFRDAIASR